MSVPNTVMNKRQIKYRLSAFYRGSWQPYPPENAVNWLRSATPAKTGTGNQGRSERAPRLPPGRQTRKVPEASGRRFILGKHLAQPRRPQQERQRWGPRREVPGKIVGRYRQNKRTAVALGVGFRNNNTSGRGFRQRRLVVAGTGPKGRYVGMMNYQ